MTQNTKTPHDFLTQAIHVNKGTLNLRVLFGNQPYGPVSYSQQATGW